tara:strand:+ start:311 stop:1393 length:1083 start_codon:yes stop_codon:yes gene_type:complete
MFKYLITKLREYIFIILTATIFSTALFSKSFAEENVFIVDNVKVEGKLNVNFNKEKYINKAFLNSFDMLMSKILLSDDLNKISKIKLKKIKTLISSFQILEETFSKNEYKATFKIFYNDKSIKKLLLEKNVSFTQPKNISAVFFPVLFVDNDMKDFDENYFYNEWTNITINNESINFILPLEDLDDLSKIKEMKNRIEELNIKSLVNKYNINNYVFALLEHNNKKLNIYIKTNFENNEVSKNISYKLENFNDKKNLNYILKDLKIKITDIWKEANTVNIFMPLSIKIKFNYKNLTDLDKLKSAFNRISIIDTYSLEEFDVNNSFFKIYYYGNPKRLQTELFKFGYQLKDDQGEWGLYLNE